jgi:hypothetical protein
MLGLFAIGSSFAACGKADLEALVSSNAAPLSSGASSGVSSGTAQGSGSSASGGSGTSPSDAGPASMPKRGIAYGYHTLLDLEALNQAGVPGVHWWLNWTTHPDDSLTGGPDYHLSGVEYVPMLWDLATLLDASPADSRYLLTFNEPNNSRQSRTLPSVAASAWRQIAGFATSRGLKIVGPSVEFGSCPTCTDPGLWMTEFFFKCGSPQVCHVDFLAMTVHTCVLGDLTNALAVLKQNQFAQYASKIWVTQFTCGQNADGSVPTEADEEAYMSQAVGVLELDPSVFRYAWYTGRPVPLAEGGAAPSQPVDLLSPCTNPCPAGSAGILTPLGQAYVQAWAASP